MRYAAQRRAHPRSRGFTLLEVLIALVILAIGLLGLAALQARGLKFNTDAYVRSQATMLAYELMEEIRTAGSAAAPNYVSAYGGATPVVFETLNCDDNTERAMAGTTTSAIDQRLACWYTDLAAKLPVGSGSVVRNGTTDEYTVTVTWYDRESDANKNQSWVMQVF